MAKGRGFRLCQAVEGVGDFVILLGRAVDRRAFAWQARRLWENPSWLPTRELEEGAEEIVVVMQVEVAVGYGVESATVVVVGNGVGRKRPGLKCC